MENESPSVMGEQVSGNKRWLKCSALKTNKKEGRAGRQRQTAEIKESGKKERRESLSKGQEAWSKQRPPVIFKTQFFPPGIVTDSQLRSWPPYLGLHLPGSIAANVTTWLHSNQWNENGSDARIYLPWRKSLASVHSSSLSHGLFVAVVWPGFVYTEEDRVTPRGRQSNKTEGKQSRHSLERKRSVFWWESQQGLWGRILFQQLSLNLN